VAPRGETVLFVQQGVPEDGEFRRVARTLAQLTGVQPRFVRTPREILESLRGVPTIKRFIEHGHGAPRGMMVGSGQRGVRNPGRDTSNQMSVRTFARFLAPRLVPDFVIGLNSCSAGADPGRNAWGPQSYQPGGAQSFAGALRDELVRAGAPRGEVRANAARGTHGNPAGRVFTVDPAHVGRPGMPLIHATWGRGADTRAWARAVQGARAYRWISGGDLGLERSAV
jgi:hypothetical protein